MGIDINTTIGYFFARVAKLQKLSKEARQLLQRASRTRRWLPVNKLQSYVGQAQHFSRYPGRAILTP
jgi:hypothetical protein